jgi:predicted transcriptional regulator
MRINQPSIMLTKTQKDQILKLTLKHPEYTDAQIAKHLGLTKEYVINYLNELTFNLTI